MATETISHHFPASLKWFSEAKRGAAQAGSRQPIFFSPPPEFGGTDQMWSPEHLLAVSLSACYTNTFFHFANLLKVPVRAFYVDVTMEVQKEGVALAATKFILHPHVEFETKPKQDTIDNLLSKAKRYCIISNSVKGEVVVEPEIA